MTALSALLLAFTVVWLWCLVKGSHSLPDRQVRCLAELGFRIFGIGLWAVEFGNLGLSNKAVRDKFSRFNSSRRLRNMFRAVQPLGAGKPLIFDSLELVSIDD